MEILKLITILTNYFNDKFSLSLCHYKPDLLSNFGWKEDGVTGWKYVFISIYWTSDQDERKTILFYHFDIFVSYMEGRLKTISH